MLRVEVCARCVARESKRKRGWFWWASAVYRVPVLASSLAEWYSQAQFPALRVLWACFGGTRPHPHPGGRCRRFHLGRQGNGLGHCLVEKVLTSESMKSFILEKNTRALCQLELEGRARQYAFKELRFRTFSARVTY